MESFGRYRIEALLGRGGMGEVHRAFDTRNERTVALKRLRSGLSDEDGFRVRFQRESRMVARLSSPHVIPIHDSGEIDGRLYLDMRLVRGRDLATLLGETGPLWPARASVIVGQVADALHSAHEDELIHRDVKPSNVLLDEHTASGIDFAYLVDFGIAKSTEPGRDPGLTGTGAAIGTLAYMSPEMFLGDVVDRRADIYALACLTFELLSGRPPFGASGMALMYEHLNTPPPRISHARPGLPGTLDDVLLRGMAKRPSDRFRTATEFSAAVARAASGVPAAGVSSALSYAPVTGGGPPPGWNGWGTGSGSGSHPGHSGYPVGRTPPRERRRLHPALVAAVAVAGTLLLVLVAVFAIGPSLTGAPVASSSGTASGSPTAQAGDVPNDAAGLDALHRVFPQSTGGNCGTVSSGSGFRTPLANIGCPGANGTRVYYELWSSVDDAEAFFTAYQAGRSSADGRQEWSLPGSSAVQGPYHYAQNGSEHLITAVYADRRYSMLVVGATQQDVTAGFARIEAVPVEQVPR